MLKIPKNYLNLISFVIAYTALIGFAIFAVTGVARFIADFIRRYG